MFSESDDKRLTIDWGWHLLVRNSCRTMYIFSVMNDPWLWSPMKLPDCLPDCIT